MPCIRSGMYRGVVPSFAGGAEAYAADRPRNALDESLMSKDLAANYLALPPGLRSPVWKCR
jgi:hypothetical protein